MAALTFTVEEDTARPMVANLRSMLESKQAKQAIGAGVRKEVRSWLRALPPNKAGFPSTGFYKSAAESVSAPEIEGDSVTISITQIGMRQRFQGGTINPINGTYLTEAASPISYGKRAGEFTGLKFAFVQDVDGRWKPALIAGDAGATPTGTKRRKGVRKAPIAPDTVLYWLIRQAIQRPDPTVLPPPTAMAASGAAALQSLLRARLHDPNAIVRLGDDEEDTLR